MTNKKQALAKFEKSIQERDKFVAEGLEGYPVRLYKITVYMVSKIDGHSFFQAFDLYTVGVHNTVENDKKHIKEDVSETIKFACKLSKYGGIKKKMTGLDIKLIEER
jgi:hypothetical protein